MRARTERDRQTCDTKRLFDTEFEAEIAAAKHMDDMEPYRCPGTNHFHLTHTDKSKRTGAGFGYIKCPTCKMIMKKKTFKKHEGKCDGSISESN